MDDDLIEPAAMVDRLRAEDKPPYYDQSMGAFIHFPRNPDGTEAAALIERQAARIVALEELVEAVAIGVEIAGLKKLGTLIRARALLREDADG